MSSEFSVRRVDFGWFVRPGEETLEGQARVEPCLGYAISHPGGLLLVDTGMGTHPDVDAHYRPRRRSLASALGAAGLALDDVHQIVNCHLHFDHCGGNPEMVGRPIFTQRAELEAARGVDYTLPDLVDAPGLRYEVLDGESEIFDGVFVLPTPGHTSGHQSVVVRQSDGTVVVAGQSHDTATNFSRDALAVRALGDGHAAGVSPPPEWVGRLLAFDPRQVFFAHDRAVWVP